jgi:hypothetical protein
VLAGGGSGALGGQEPCCPAGKQVRTIPFRAALVQVADEHRARAEHGHPRRQARLRIRVPSSFRFSSRFAITRSGAWAVIAARSGFCGPRTGVTAKPTRWVHQSVAATSRPGADRGHPACRPGIWVLTAI